jgi:hypothetical protein
MLELQDYLYGVALGGAFFLLTLAPIVYAGVVAYWPGERPAKKLRFAVLCGLLAYGSVALTYFLFSPIEMVAIYFAPHWQDQGWDTIPIVFGTIAQALEPVSLAVGIVVALVSPIYIRRNIWAKIYPDTN